MVKSALLVIDVQRGMFTLPASPAYQGEAVVGRIAGLLHQARAQAVPVIHVQHEDEPGGVFERGTEGWQIHSDVAPQPGELVIGKCHCSAFQGTGLHESLASLEIGEIVVAGLQTQFCVDTACRVAATFGYRVTLAADAHTTFDSEQLTASQIIAHHNRTLRAFAAIKQAGEIVLRNKMALAS
jgi:nicotinamidase-related amidase